MSTLEAAPTQVESVAEPTSLSVAIPQQRLSRIIVATGLSAVLLWLSFLPFQQSMMGLLAFLMPAGLIHLARDPRRLPVLAWPVLFAGSWVAWQAILFEPQAMEFSHVLQRILLATYLATHFPAFVLLCRYAIRRLHLPPYVAAPIVWIGIEFWRAHLFGGASVGKIGQAFAYNPLIRDAAEFGGSSVLSGFAVWFSAAIVESYWVLRRVKRFRQTVMVKESDSLLGSHNRLVDQIRRTPKSQEEREAEKVITRAAREPWANSLAVPLSIAVICLIAVFNLSQFAAMEGIVKVFEERSVTLANLAELPQSLEDAPPPEEVKQVLVDIAIAVPPGQTRSLVRATEQYRDRTNYATAVVTVGTIVTDQRVGYGAALLMNSDIIETDLVPVPSLGQRLVSWYQGPRANDFFHVKIETEQGHFSGRSNQGHSVWIAPLVGSKVAMEDDIEQIGREHSFFDQLDLITVSVPDGLAGNFFHHDLLQRGAIMGAIRSRSMVILKKPSGSLTLINGSGQIFAELGPEYARTSLGQIADIRRLRASKNRQWIIITCAAVTAILLPFVAVGWALGKRY